jgi:hypothetical protein
MATEVVKLSPPHGLAGGQQFAIDGVVEINRCTSPAGVPTGCGGLDRRPSINRLVAQTGSRQVSARRTWPP